MSNRVIHFEIQADDVERAKSFYEKTLGWKISQLMKKEESGMDYWGIETGVGPGINGGLYVRPKKEDEKFYLYDCTVLVDDIEKTIKDIRDNGGVITKEKDEMPGVGWFAGAIDTEGNRLGLMQATDWKPE